MEQKDKAYEKIYQVIGKCQKLKKIFILAETNTEDDEIELTFGKDGGPKEIASEFIGKRQHFH